MAGLHDRVLVASWSQEPTAPAHLLSVPVQAPVILTQYLPVQAQAVGPHREPATVVISYRSDSRIALNCEFEGAGLPHARSILQSCRAR